LAFFAFLLDASSTIGRRCPSFQQHTALRTRLQPLITCDLAAALASEQLELYIANPDFTFSTIIASASVLQWTAFLLSRETTQSKKLHKFMIKYNESEQI
jgi:hypothetical protein